jgi:HSP20 family protein
MVSRFLTPFGGRSPRGEEDTFLELPHELNQTSGDEGGGKFMATPRLDVYESDRVIEMTAELPGVAEGDIEVSVEGDILTIRGDKRDQHEGKKVHFAERSYGGFQRSIQLPFAPDPDRMEASSENGVLSIRFPRVEPERTHRIPIGGTAGADKQEGGRGSRRAIGRRWSGEAAPAGEEELNLSEEQAVRGEGAPA